MSQWKIPPHTFSALYRHFKFGIPPGGFLSAVLKNNALIAAASADQHNRLCLSDIILFTDQARNHHQDCAAADDFTGFDLKWETWRMRYSPEANEIEFDTGDDE